MKPEKSNLFTPLKIGNLEIKNRVVMPPMCMYSAEDGYVNDWHIQHYSTRAIGGTGLIIVEATGVLPYVSSITDNDLAIWDDKYIDGLSKLVKAIKDNGAAAAIQINHAGRKCESVKIDKIYAPSAIAFNDKYRTPVEMTKDDINEVVDAFVKAFVRAKKAGFDMIEVHAAHGYLISTFLSPLSNKRTDEYGKNRAKILEDILRKGKEAVGKDYPIQIRISSYDWKEGGNTVKDFADMLKPLEDEGLFDAINVSTGAVTADGKIIPYDGYQVPFCRELKLYMKVPCIGGGLIYDPKMANMMVRNGAADAIYIGREMLRNPYWALQAARTLGIDVPFPKQYEMAKR
ncbi:NADH:flavin oxidoreductase/NADH oxidase [uncultured Brachyspira sp.]|uniref:NADH:flavin oxidoreductase/NADH oxidase n=1 Tax=uncultured Brachyspira sp. TaxID=221953 RepID=UPI00262FBF83|nr:NADH:flavin oxidoreductase/NADH oxidase [uncultured Brachyspira sp.]